MGLLPAASHALAASGLSERVAERHLQRDGPMWGPFGFAAGTISPGSGVGSYVQWDGNAVWGATAYWAYLVAARLGRWVEAGRLRDQLTGLIDAHGFREFYDAETGEPVAQARPRVHVACPGLGHDRPVRVTPLHVLVISPPGSRRTAGRSSPCRR